MREKVLCINCNRLIYITDDIDDHHEYSEEEVFGVVECSHCTHKNALVYSISVDFNAVMPTLKDIEDFL